MVSINKYIVNYNKDSIRLKVFIFAICVAIVNGLFQQTYSINCAFNNNNNGCNRSLRQEKRKLLVTRHDQSIISCFHTKQIRNEKHNFFSLNRRGGSSTTLQNSSDSFSPKTNNVTVSSSYYLLLSKRIWIQIISLTSIIVDTQKFLRLSSRSNILGTLLVTKSSWMIQKIALPLLSSSCCLIQLFLNLFGFGCAGFNTFLGPSRPWFTSLLLSWTIMSYSFQKIWFLSTFFTWCLALLPEITHVYNINVQKQYLSTENEESSVKLDDTSLDALIVANIEVDVPSMGCVACINKISASMVPFTKKASNDAKVIGASAYLNEKSEERSKRGGRVQFKVQGNSLDQVEEMVKDVTNAITESGFNCVVSSIQYTDK